MTNDQLKEFVARQKRLTGIIQEASGLVQKLDMEHCAQTLQQLRQKISSDTFKIMVMGKMCIRDRCKSCLHKFRIGV